jgi:uncharacterized Rossmann fold enzyme
MTNTTVELSPSKPEGTIDEIFQLDCVYSADQRQTHIDYTLKLQVPWAIRHKVRPGKVAIVASGPSATESVDLLKDWDGEIWGINGAFVWMRKRGIRPTAFVGLDPEPILKDYLTETPDDATYYLAAQVHPEVFDHLAANKVKLWFAADGQVQFPFGAVPIYGGSTCVGRAPNLAYHLGYREVHIFGADSSFTSKNHVYDDAGLPPGSFPVEMGGRMFMTTRQMFQQACDFAEQMVEWARPGDDGSEPLSVSLYGDGLLQAMFAETMQNGGYHQYLREAYKDGLTRKQRRAVRRAVA